MTSRRLCFALLGALTSSLLIDTPRAAANDSAMGGEGADLVPLTVTNVRMQSEDILIRAVGQDWEIQADYVFESSSDEPVELQVGFPEYACEGGDPAVDPDVMCDTKPLRFKSMVTTVDGVTVEQRRGTLRKGHAWRPRLGQVWLYDVRFMPKQVTRISHHYRVSQGAISDGTALGYYVTRTGAPWAGAIGHARFRIHVPVESTHVELETEGSGLSVTRRIVEVDGKPTGEMLLEAQDWEPHKDIEFSYLVQRGAPIMDVDGHARFEADQTKPESERCKDIVGLMIRGSDRRKPSAITAQDAAEFAQAGIGNARICRNYIFAAHGRRFRDDALNRYFYGPNGFVDGGWPYGPFEPNPSFDMALIAQDEWAILTLIRKIEHQSATDW